MVHTTIKQALKNTLQDLRREDFLEFCHQLKDRREEPRVRYGDVENKSVLQITDLLVSTFTERGALPVASSILKLINCNQDAETLYSETRACMDVKGDPTFRKTSSGELDTKPSQEALNHKAGRWPFSSPVTGKTPQEVEAEAEARVLSEGGDPRNERLVLSMFMIQFGQYKDQTFKWLLENDLSYAAKMVACHEKRRQNTKCQSSLMANKLCQLPPEQEVNL
ncbi:uncharacterized protein LOC114556911 [Perca flavescens]|uniref:uncharacterized protein LOC114556911 n=1 Tax=Perca flavescens TaxID=8167 RepID=UPI00106EB43A|nr:uncharacterized protein LOC114556911 [Perca flavescens]